MALVAVLSSPACGAFGETAASVSPTPARTSPSASPTAVETASDGLPPIVVDSPPAGAEIASPLVVRGTANVHDAIVHIRLTAEDGSLIAGVDTSATCANGCRGAFRVELHFFVERPQDAVLEVFGEAETDGAPAAIVKVPVEVFP